MHRRAAIGTQSLGSHDVDFEFANVMLRFSGWTIALFLEIGYSSSLHYVLCEFESRHRAGTCPPAGRISASDNFDQSQAWLRCWPPYIACGHLLGIASGRFAVVESAARGGLMPQHATEHQEWSKGAAMRTVPAVLGTPPIR